MRSIQIQVTLTDDGGRTLMKHFDDAQKCLEWVKSKQAAEKEDLEKAPKPAPYKSRGMNKGTSGD